MPQYIFLNIYFCIDQLFNRSWIYLDSIRVIANWGYYFQIMAYIFLLLKIMFFRNILHKVGSLKDWRNRSVWSKTTLISGGVGGAGVDPPSWKTDTFFLRSMALSLSIYRNFQSNGAKWWSLKQKNYTILYWTNCT